ncbi:Hypothetical predicted protein, partial [Pelobates cultripes]
EYSQISGYKVNLTKSSAIRMHLSATDEEMVSSTMQLRLPDSIKYLGIWVTKVKGALHKANYHSLIQAIKRDLE